MSASAESVHANPPGEIPRRYPPVPRVGVAAVVFNAHGEVLLVQRGRPPRQGQWSLPGGLLDLGERLADGVRREVWEECAVDIEVGEVVAAYEPILLDETGRVEYHYVVIDFWARHRSGEPRAQDDAAAVTWAALDALSGYALSDDTQAVIFKAFDAWRPASLRPA